MRDYSAMSDFKINLMVAKVNKWTSISFVHDIHSGKWNPCQNPADAWSIIVDNQISLDSIHENGQKWLAFGGEDCEHRSVHQNPLRAAMIVFLKMQDDKSE